MRAVIYDWGGTGYEAFHIGDASEVPWDEKEVQLYGKTGTTNYTVFACYAKARDGRCLAMAVVAEVEADGSEVAAPLARDILLECAKEGYLPAARIDLSN
jgi:hypothetical protein